MNDNESRLDQLFKQHDNEYIKFGDIPIRDLRHTRPDICALIYLHEKLGGRGDAIIAAANHDEIWLNFNNLERLTEEDVIYLTRCGVRYDEENKSLAMFV